MSPSVSREVGFRMNEWMARHTRVSGRMGNEWQWRQGAGGWGAREMMIVGVGSVLVVLRIRCEFAEAGRPRVDVIG